MAIHNPGSDLELASAARNSNGSSVAVPTEGSIAARGAWLNVTAASGTSPTLDVKLETSSDGTNWYTVAAFAQKTGISSERKGFAPLDDYARWTWTVGGTTPNFTFAIAVSELVG